MQTASSLRQYTLSVVMIVKNEAANLAISLAAVAGWVDEIVILDSGSTDNSQAVAHAWGAKWFTHTDWQGFGKQRQRAQGYATGDWILALDADEEVSPELKTHILEVITQPPKQTVYGIKRLDCIFGHCIDHPAWPVKAHWRLYPKTFTYNDNAVHESIDITHADTQILKGFLKHHTAPTPEFWLSKRLNYALTWAIEQHARGKQISIAGVILRNVWAFIKQYVLDGRFLQGKYGLIYAMLFQQYTFNKYGILYDLSHNRAGIAFEKKPLTPALCEQLKQLKNTQQSNLSVVMIVKNEAKHLGACLEIVHLIADEIVILDSGSTDQTETIAKQYGAVWRMNTDWQGFGKQRQLAQTYASKDYVLVIDADERPDAALLLSIMHVLQQPVNANVYLLARVNYFCGTPTHLRGWYRDQQKRLYARTRYQYSSLDVHESLDSKGAPEVKLKGLLHHHTNDDLHHFVLKNIRYSHDWANERIAKKKASTLGAILRGRFSFFREFILRGAFLGGAYGILLAIASKWYTFNKYLMLMEANKQLTAQPTKKTHE